MIDSALPVIRRNIPTISLEIRPGELAQIVESVFAARLNLEVAETRTPWFPAECRLTAAVHLAGDWNGAVLLECDRSQACQFAGRFLSLDPPGTVDDVVRDMLGELANMIGGNLKSVLSRGIHLSRPLVVDGSKYCPWVYGIESRQQLAFQCDEGPFWITVLTARS
ncbi:MAG: chemotaxis protein CheX [Bryobacterales bacterium]|nr:chemotaxis protein CheX [Bryobacterales bacterium]